MGTNYYSVKRDVDYNLFESFWDLRGTEDCIHIGKSSVGWCFSLHIVPRLGINTIEDWIRMFIEPDRIIIDEYREIVPFDRMMGIITARGRADPCNWTQEMLDRNFAELGPNNLVRHSINSASGCVSHGEGTWDLIVGEFS